MHIYTVSLQPATAYIYECGSKSFHSGFQPDELIHTCCWGKKMRADTCVVQCFYDRLNIWCAEDKGCNDPGILAAKKAQEFSNRSAGQKARWKKEQPA